MRPISFDAQRLVCYEHANASTHLTWVVIYKIISAGE
ncbi:hypothetical protein RSAG8_13973, partial [Rhizoctonia solani AG-8 WAC10335]